MSKKIILDLKKPLLGIDRNVFVNPIEAVIRSDSLYNGSFLFDLMKYDKSDDSYFFEDDEVLIYDSYRPTSKSSCFIRLKPKLIIESRYGKLLLFDDYNVHQDLNSISYQFEKFKTNEISQGVLVTSSSTNEKGLKNVKQSTYLGQKYLVEIIRIDAHQINEFFKGRLYTRSS